MWRDDERLAFHFLCKSPCIGLKVSIGMGIYFFIKADYMLAAFAGFWPLVTLLLMWLTPSTKIGVIQTTLMYKIGYDKII